MHTHTHILDPYPAEIIFTNTSRLNRGQASSPPAFGGTQCPFAIRLYSDVLGAPHSLLHKVETPPPPPSESGRTTYNRSCRVVCLCVCVRAQTPNRIETPCTCYTNSTHTHTNRRRRRRAAGNQCECARACRHPVDKKFAVLTRSVAPHRSFGSATRIARAAATWCDRKHAPQRCRGAVNMIRHHNSCPLGSG